MGYRSRFIICLSGKTDPWSIGSAWAVDHVAEWEQGDLNDLAPVSWVGYVLHKSCATYQDDRCISYMINMIYTSDLYDLYGLLYII